jgi:hypothetical protein
MDVKPHTLNRPTEEPKSARTVLCIHSHTHAYIYCALQQVCLPTSLPKMLKKYKAYLSHPHDCKASFIRNILSNVEPLLGNDRELRDHTTAVAK